MLDVHVRSAAVLQQRFLLPPNKSDLVMGIAYLGGSAALLVNSDLI